ncbi:MAG TPA: protein translocase subunit SecF [Thermoanaerobaculia bacterium]|nr:protein translocase subunit SecF [Thermoanaerobaculia bacterium]
MNLFVNTNFDFMKWRFHAIAISLLFIAIGLGLLFTRGVNLGIDFAGGANVILRFQENPPISDLRSIATGATIQQYGPAADNSVLLRLPKQETEGDYAGAVVATLNERLNEGGEGKLDLNLQGRAALADLLRSADPDRLGASPEASGRYDEIAASIIARRSELGIFTDVSQATAVEGVSPAVAQLIRDSVFLGRFNVLNQESVGPQVGRELQQKAMWAVVLATLAMGVYVAVRFDFKFGVAAIISLVHDSMLAIAFLAMINGEFEIITIAAFLMIIGYSINDTVVVYDRVRENVKKLRIRADFRTVINRSLNQTLSRTILTGGSVLMVLMTLIIFGGEVLNEFAWLLFIGTIGGTFSTLFVVPAIVLAWNDRFGSKGSVYGGGGRRVEETKSAGERRDRAQIDQDPVPAGRRR